ncbi:MAG: Gfo/Idh/MocA family oxidoreductase [Planctomycetes bacterium]|nr:Gfo/Idh/MocA family oxidoreductase [Planctomycetota bacterium]
MSTPLRIGILGLTHDHIWDHLPDVQTNADTRLVAVADPHQALIGRAEAEFHCRPYSNPETMLDSEELDAVYIYSDNAAGPELTEMATSRGLHVLIEKPMAADLAGADRMLAAAAAADVRLLVNWPFAWWPQMQHALKLADEGAIGDIWQVRYRAAHAGPRELGCSDFFCEWLYDPKRNGPGGAFMDYCCYGALLARTVLGMPNTVMGIAKRLVKQDIDVEDNGMLIMNYPNAIAVSEGSWTQIGKLSAYMTMVYGTTGTLMLEPRNGGRLLLATHEQQGGVSVDVPELPVHLQNATAHFVHCIRTGEAALSMCDLNICRDTQAILESGINAARTGTSVSL